MDDPLALALNMNLAAVNICLHEAAVAKAQRGKLPATLIMESQNRCMAAAMEVAEDIRLSQQLDPSKVRPLSISLSESVKLSLLFTRRGECFRWQTHS